MEERILKLEKDGKEGKPERLGVKKVVRLAPADKISCKAMKENQGGVINLKNNRSEAAKTEVSTSQHTKTETFSSQLK